MRLTPAALTFLALLAAGCASYTPSSAPVPRAADAKAEVAEGGVVIGVDPYVEPERQKSAFDADFDEAGVLAIQLSAANEGGKRVLIRRSDMLLTLPDGSQIRPAGATSVVTKVGESGSVVGATIMFGIIGLLAAGSAEDTARAARTNDYRSKELQDLSLAPGESGDGFVFFIPPPETEPFETAELAVRVVDTETVTSHVLRVTLRGLGFRPPEEERGAPKGCRTAFHTGPACK